MSLSSIPRLLRHAVLQRDAGRCRYCALHQVGQVATFHVNHVVPRSRGGMTDFQNLVLQCPYCSLHKADRESGVDRDTQTSVPLFHPLRDVWQEHFVLAADGTVHGLTPPGRATVACLHMNDPLPRTARALQRILGLV